MTIVKHIKIIKLLKFKQQKHMEKLKISEILEINRDINLGMTFNEEFIKPLILSDTKIKVKGFLHLINQMLKPFIDTFIEKEKTLLETYGVKSEGEQYEIKNESIEEYNTKYSELLDEEVELEFKHLKMTYEDLNITTQLPLISFCKFFIKD